MEMKYRMHGGVCCQHACQTNALAISTKRHLQCTEIKRERERERERHNYSDYCDDQNG